MILDLDPGPDQSQNVIEFSLPKALPVLKVLWTFTHNFLSNPI